VDFNICAGFSQHDNVVTAAKEACDQAWAQADSNRTTVGMILTTPPYDPQKVAETIHSALPQVRIFGGTTAGIIFNRNVHRYGVAVILLQSNTTKMQPLHAMHLNLKDLQEAGEALISDDGQDFGQKDRKFLLFLFDGLLENMSSFCRGIRADLGEFFPIFAAGCSDALNFSQTTQYHNRQTSSHSACGLLIGGELSSYYAKRHGWKPLGKPRLVKKTRGNIIEQIADAPAMKIYEEFFQDNLGALKNDVFGCLTSRYPLGIRQSAGQEYRIHNVMDILEDGSLVCQDAVAEGSEIHIMIGNKASCLQSASEAVDDLKKFLEDTPVRALFILESAARWQILKHSWNEEINIITKAFDESVPVIGLLTYGEIFAPGNWRYPGQAHLENGNIVLLAIV